MTQSTRIKHAITLYRPWGYAIAHLGKNIENRSWECPLKSGEWIAIHNGKKWDNSGSAFLTNMFRGRGDIILPNAIDDLPGYFVALARFSKNSFASDSPWAVKNLWGWEFDAVVPLDLIHEGRGRQGLWALEGDKVEAFSILIDNFYTPELSYE